MLLPPFLQAVSSALDAATPAPSDFKKFLLLMLFAIIFFFLDDSVRFVSFNIDCAERACRTKVFASSTADAFFHIDGRNLL
jgi:hypothetical protein